LRKNKYLNILNIRLKRENALLLITSFKIKKKKNLPYPYVVEFEAFFINDMPIVIDLYTIKFAVVESVNYEMIRQRRKF